MSSVDRYNERRLRLRLSRPETAAAIGYRLGCVSHRSQCGPTALPPPGVTVDRLAAIVGGQALRD